MAAQHTLVMFLRALTVSNCLILDNYNESLKLNQTLFANNGNNLREFVVFDSCGCSMSLCPAWELTLK
jgi:hypothetical protein